MASFNTIKDLDAVAFEKSLEAAVGSEYNRHLYTAARFVHGAGKGKDVAFVLGLKADEDGFTIDDIRAMRQSGKINAMGIKGGVEVVPGRFLLGVDCDFPGVKVYLESKSPELAATFSTLGSKPVAGHLWFLTDGVCVNTSPMKDKSEAIGLQGAGRHLFEFCKHRNGKVEYCLERQAILSFLPLASFLPLVGEAVQHFGLSWTQAEETVEDEPATPATVSPDREGIKKLLRVQAKDRKLAELLTGNPSSKDRSGNDFALAGKCAYYDLSTGQAWEVLNQFGSPKARERGGKYINATIARAYASSPSSPLSNGEHFNVGDGKSSPSSQFAEGSKNDKFLTSPTPIGWGSGEVATVNTTYEGLPLGEITPEMLEPQEFVAEPYIVKGHVTLVTACPKALKSTWVLSNCVAIAVGRNTYSGHPTIQQKIGFFDLEDSIAHTVKMIRALSFDFSPEEKTLLDKNFILFSQPLGFSLSDDAMLRDTVVKFGLQLVVIDTLRRGFDGDENDSGEVSKLYNEVLVPIMKQCGVSFILIHHNRKPNQNGFKQGADFASIRGSSDMFAMPGSIVMLDRLRKKNEVIVHHVGSKWGCEAPSRHLRIEYTDDAIRFVDLGEVEEHAGAVQKLTQSIIDWLVQNNRRADITTAELTGEFGKGRTLDEAIKQLKEERKFIGTGKTNHSPFRFVLPTTGETTLAETSNERQPPPVNPGKRIAITTDAGLCYCNPEDLAARLAMLKEAGRTVHSTAPEGDVST